VSTLTVLAGTANPRLAGEVATLLGVALAERVASHFPDGELHVEIGTSVRGRDVYLIQPTSPAPETHLLQLLLLADACRRAGAVRLTAVMPYVAYARQDRRGAGREPVGARVMAELLSTGGLHRVVAVDLHSPALEGVFTIPVEHLTAVPLLASALPALAGPAVIVAPDLGATKLAESYARLLDLPVALVHKRRLTGSRVTVRGVTGEVRGRSPIVVDDMITTGGTIEAAITALLEAGCSAEVLVSATHGLFVDGAASRLAALPVREVLVTDSVASAAADGLTVRRVSLASLLADAIRRLHEDRSLGDLVVHR
jgi:ribose-phosphate pyrophosphokinase